MSMSTVINSHEIIFLVRNQACLSNLMMALYKEDTSQWGILFLHFFLMILEFVDFALNYIDVPTDLFI